MYYSRFAARREDYKRFSVPPPPPRPSFYYEREELFLRAAELWDLELWPERRMPSAAKFTAAGGGR